MKKKKIKIKKKKGITVDKMQKSKILSTTKQQQTLNPKIRLSV